MRQLIEERICARWRRGAKFPALFYQYANVHCTNDLYRWMNTLTDKQILEALEVQYEDCLDRNLF
jgi:hypothetical protein